ncbi:hypothetical protein [Aequorivita sinensis]|uniref:hypothetical protein n=1 Tax=Aequorivita sinensis TaxID=1382458 RepID=UPI001123300C|nr:hypothetical protein [Aequorivita sinensis]
MEKQDILSRFNKFKHTQSYPFARSYFTDEVAILLRDADYIMQMIRIKKTDLEQYCEFKNYSVKFDTEKIQDDDFLILVTIRHFDMYIEYLLTDKGKVLKGNLKNKSFGKNEENKLKEFNEYVFIKGQLQSSEQIFKLKYFEPYKKFREPIKGGWSQENLKLYFKDDNNLVYIKGQSVLFGKYYYIFNYVKFYLENAEEYKMSNELYYEISHNENNTLSLTNENYGHFYVFDRVESV